MMAIISMTVTLIITVILICVVIIAACKAGGQADEFAGYEEDELWKKKM